MRFPLHTIWQTSMSLKAMIVGALSTSVIRPNSRRDLVLACAQSLALDKDRTNVASWYRTAYSSKYFSRLKYSNPVQMCQWLKEKKMPTKKWQRRTTTKLPEEQMLKSFHSPRTVNDSLLIEQHQNHPQQNHEITSPSAWQTLISRGMGFLSQILDSDQHTDEPDAWQAITFQPEIKRLLWEPRSCASAGWPLTWKSDQGQQQLFS